MRRLLRQLAPLCAAGLVATPGAALAAGQAQTPPAAPAVEQYVEQVPTAKGASTPGVGRQKTRSLSPAAANAIHGTTPALAAALTKVATSSAYGAPKVGETARVSTGATEAGTTSDARLVGLLVVLIATTVGALVLTARRARS